MEEVRERGEYPTAKEAERITRIVLSTLGGHLTGPAKADLVKRLPVEAATVIAEQVPVISPLTDAQFVDSVAARRRNVYCPRRLPATRRRTRA